MRERHNHGGMGSDEGKERPRRTLHRGKKVAKILLKESCYIVRSDLCSAH